MDRDGVEAHKHIKKNLANIQPSGPHTLPITHMHTDFKLHFRSFLADRQFYTTKRDKG